MFELIDSVPSNAVIKVIGVGGGGGNAVKHMIENEVEGVDFICANTDAQALSDVVSKTILQLVAISPKVLGQALTRKLGALPQWRIAIVSRMRCAVPIWCLSLPVWVGAPVREALLWWPR